MAVATSSSTGSRRQDESEFNLREWGMRARIISHENSTSSSRRLSGSHIRSSFREVVDATRSFRSNITVSSTASSPGYSLREEIDPSTYSFTTALKALQARTVYSWEFMSGDGLALNSKWNEAEKYICNPKSGEVPLECLSAKSLSTATATTTRSFRNLLTSKITMSAPLSYPSSKNFHTILPSTISSTTTTTLQDEEEQDDDHEVVLPISSTEAQEKKKISMTRDIGTQSTPPHELSSGSPSPAPTPSIQESPRKHNSPLSTEKFNSETVVANEENAEKEDMITMRNEGERNNKVKKIMCSSCKCRQGGCLSWSLWMRKRRREKHRQSKKNIFFQHVSGC